MDSSRFHVFWGFLLYFCSKIMDGLNTNLMRGTYELRPSQAVALIALGQLLTLAPFVPVMLKNWGLRTKMEWAVFLFVCSLADLGCIALLFCSERMAVGNLAAIIISNILWTPVMQGVVNHKCLSSVDFLGIIMASVGVFMVAITNTSFHSLISVSHPLVPIIVAMAIGLNHAIFPFMIGVFKHVHWTNYVFLRSATSVVVVPIYLTIDGGWNLPPASSWSGVVLSLESGSVLNLLRVSSIYGCQELESWKPGSAGVVGNIINACVIPIGATLAFALYEEVMAPLAIIGATVIFASVVALAFIKFYAGNGEEKVDERKSLLDS